MSRKLAKMTNNITRKDGLR